MDFHSHLTETEIIGLLGGYWDPDKKTLTVKQGFPCKAIPTDNDHLNVEMDPTSEWLVRQEISELNMRVVGWYHSHPTFLPNPSNIDIQNQMAYQNLFMDKQCNESDPNHEDSSQEKSPTSKSDADLSGSGNFKMDEQNKDQGSIDILASESSSQCNEAKYTKNEPSDGVKPANGSFESLRPSDEMQNAPFIGAIVGPYDQNLPKCYSVINWFMVINESQLSTNSNIVPKKLVIEKVRDTCVLPNVVSKVEDLLEHYVSDIHRVRFMERWKPNENMLKLTKCLFSLASRMPWVKIADNKAETVSEPAGELDAGFSDNNETNLSTLDKNVSLDSKVDISSSTEIGNRSRNLSLEIEKPSFQTITNSNNCIPHITIPRNQIGVFSSWDYSSSLSKDDTPADKCKFEMEYNCKKKNSSDSKIDLQTLNEDSFSSDSDLSSVDIENFNTSEKDILSSSIDSKSNGLKNALHNSNPKDSEPKDSTLPLWLTTEPLLMLINSTLSKWK
ncbi:hypothetical protein BB560_004406 [Smittium megazygosporum]|uniref:MPN domain-containing protein n=1 Tax=Smittium megazygosporum TaxID=133381 RepID=A0A2T9Z9A9_9FUNG|nr:hypothetical protein BB560_004406 [Smittium megazygosporum]